MCRITRGMITRANARLSHSGVMSCSPRGTFIIRTHFDGREYSQRITGEQIREAYRKALDK